MDFEPTQVERAGVHSLDSTQDHGVLHVVTSHGSPAYFVRVFVAHMARARRPSPGILLCTCYVSKWRVEHTSGLCGRRSSRAAPWQRFDGDASCAACRRRTGRWQPVSVGIDRLVCIGSSRRTGRFAARPGCRTASASAGPWVLGGARTAWSAPPKIECRARRKGLITSFWPCGGWPWQQLTMSTC